MVDVFEEVEEQLRSDRYRTLFRKVWPYALGAAVLALLAFAAVWGYRAYQSNRAASASETYAAATEAFGRNAVDEAEQGFAEVANSGPRGYRALALMQQAGLRLNAGETDEAVALLDRAADVAPDPLLEDSARLKAAYVLFDTATLADLEQRLTPLTQAGRPYVALAREALAMKRLATGDAAQARTALAALAILPDATDDLRARAQAVMALIDSGGHTAVAPAASAAAQLPTPAANAPAAVGSAGDPPQGPPAAAQPSVPGAQP